MKLILTIVAEIDVNLEDYKDCNTPITTLEQAAKFETAMLEAGETSLDDLMSVAKIISTTIVGKSE